MPALYWLVQLLVGFEIHNSEQNRYARQENCRDGIVHEMECIALVITSGVYSTRVDLTAFLMERMIPQVPASVKAKGRMGSLFGHLVGCSYVTEITLAHIRRLSEYDIVL